MTKNDKIVIIKKWQSVGFHNAGGIVGRHDYKTQFEFIVWVSSIDFFFHQCRCRFFLFEEQYLENPKHRLRFQLNIFAVFSEHQNECISQEVSVFYLNFILTCSSWVCLILKIVLRRVVVHTSSMTLNNISHIHQRKLEGKMCL